MRLSSWVRRPRLRSIDVALTQDAPQLPSNGRSNRWWPDWRAYFRAFYVIHYGQRRLPSRLVCPPVEMDSRFDQRIAPPSLPLFGGEVTLEILRAVFHGAVRWEQTRKKKKNDRPASVLMSSMAADGCSESDDEGPYRWRWINCYLWRWLFLHDTIELYIIRDFENSLFLFFFFVNS